ncbi:MAG: hypothetical protein J2P15_01815 [Micromonosporaceae bacterium]|nr:hypothetical protein [Micromonosporaceae bacterium]
MPLPPLPSSYSVHNLEPPAAPPEWGPLPGIEQVKETIYQVLAAHGRLRPDAGDPDPDQVGLLSSWAQEVLACGLAPGSSGEAYFDGKRIWDASDYAGTVELLAEATRGDWRPERLHSADADPGGVVIEFEHRGRPERWTIENAASRYVSDELFGYAELFAEANLPGRFVYLPTSSQEVHLLYLPAALTGDLRRALGWPSPEALLASVRAALAAKPAPLLRALRDTVGWLGTWPELTAAPDGGSPLREAVLAGHAELADQLLDLGADPQDATGLPSGPALRDVLDKAAAAWISTRSALLVKRI